MANSTMTVLVHVLQYIITTFQNFENKFENREEVSLSEIMKMGGGVTTMAILIAKIKHPKSFATNITDDDLWSGVLVEYV